MSAASSGQKPETIAFVLTFSKTRVSSSHQYNLQFNYPNGV